VYINLMLEKWNCRWQRMGWTGSHMTSSLSADLFLRTRTELLSKLNLLASSSSLDEGSTNMICSGGEERVVSHTCTDPLKCVASFMKVLLIQLQMTCHENLDGISK